jgi:hypothetical protein
MMGNSGTASAGLTTKFGASLFTQLANWIARRLNGLFVRVVICGNGWKPLPNLPVTTALTLVN